MIIVPVWMRVMIASGLCFAAGGISALYISAGSVGWFESLNRPPFFALPLPLLFFVMIVTYALLSIAASIMWIFDPRQWDFRGWVPLFFSHLLLQMAWIILFFGYNVVFLSLIVAFFLSIYVMLLTAAAWPRSKIAFGIMLVYLIGTLYTLGMNMAAWSLN